MSQVIRKYHFRLDFYSDQALTEYVGSLFSEDWWQYFRVNGVQMSQEGVFVEDFNCVSVDFITPENAPGWLYNRILYISVLPTLAAVNFGDVKTDVVLVVDESGSMSTEHDWIPDMVQELESDLLSRSIGPNRYALVGYGGDGPDVLGQPNFRAHKHFANGSDWFNAGDISVAIADGLNALAGGIEDGYEGINYALSAYSFREDAVLSIILITDEDRDVVDETITYDKLYNTLLGSCGGSGSLTSIVNVEFRDGDNNRALGIDYKGNAFIADGVDFELSGGGYGTNRSASWEPGDFTAKQDYVDLALDLRGAAFDLNILREGGANVVPFTKAVSSLKVEQIVNAYLAITPINPIAFYCFKEVEDDGVIPIDFTPTFENEYIDGMCVHFRVSFYNDADYTSLAHSSFSLLDQRRWFRRLSSESRFQPLGSRGIFVQNGETVTAIYVPEFLTVEDFEQQREYQDGDYRTETPLLCGVKYFVKLETYIDGEFVLFDEFTHYVSCDSFPNTTWREVEDKTRWVSSGQGMSDLRVVKSDNETMYPRVCFDDNSIAMIAWQDFKTTSRSLQGFDYKPSIFYGIYESASDICWSSGQGFFDTQAISQGFKPKLLLDDASNFFLTASNLNSINAWNCILEGQKTATEDATSSGSSGSSGPCQLTDDRLANVDNASYDAGQYLKCRVCEQDAKGSYVVDSEIVVSEVSEYIIRLECSGLPGAYAVRLRNEDDEEWSDWINIDEEIRSETSRLTAPSSDATSNEIFSAYSIDHDRFITPWIVSCGIGLKHISVQVLTVHGISPVFGCSVLANVPELDYQVEFTVDSKDVPRYRGLPILAKTGSADVSVKVTITDLDRLNFYLENLAKWNKLNSLNSGLTFDIIQQGLNDRTNLPLAQQSEGVYTGSFNIPVSDGIYNKDGLSAILVNLPAPCRSGTGAQGGGSCNASDDIDDYNRSNIPLIRRLSSAQNEESQDISPDTVLRDVVGNNVVIITDKQEMKQAYKKDDKRFVFGNPKAFISKSL